MEQIAINILPKGAKPVCHSSQFDEGRQIMFNLFNDTTPYTLSGSETISVLVRRPDGAEVIDSVTNTSDSYVIWDVSANACELSGVCECELSIVENGILLGSRNFTMKVEEDAYGGKNIEVRTASGRIATFTTNMVEAFKSLKSDINPVQDLHGYTKPWSGGGGKNKLNCTAATQTINGITFTVKEDGSIKLNGTATAYTEFALNASNLLKSGTYIVNGVMNGVGQTRRIIVRDSQSIIARDTGSGAEFSLENDSNVSVSITISNGETLNNSTWYPMIRLASVSDASFEPYSNVCPISGFSALNVTRTGVNLWDEQWEVGYISVLDGTNSNSQINIRSKNYIPIKPNVSLYLKANIATAYCPIIFYDKDKNFISSVAQTLWNRTITTPENAYYMRFYMHDSYGTTYNHDISINYPSSDTEYHAYNGQTATVNFGQTVYGGVADVTNGKATLTHLLKRIGDLTWYYNSTYDFFSAGLSDLIDGYSELDIKSSAFESIYGRSNANMADAPNGTINHLNTTVKIKNTDYTDATAFKTALANETIWYKLATPIEITTTPENLTAIVGQNNVYADTNGDTEVEYYIEV